MSELDQTYTEVIRLPSCKANVYPDNPELSGDIRIRMMDVNDEKKVFGSVSEDMINRLLKSCVVEPEDFDPLVLIPNDRHYLLVKLRVLSYGDQYHGEGVCPECGAEEEFAYSIDDVPIFELDEEFKDPIEVTLPVCKREVGIRILRQKDVDAIKAKAKQMAKSSNVNVREVEFVERVVRKIASIDGKPVNRAEAELFVKGLKAKDRAYMEYILDKTKLGYDNVITVKCSKCGEEYEIPFRLTGEFFRPRFDF